jgi:hypothetical protein
VSAYGQKAVVEAAASPGTCSEADVQAAIVVFGCGRVEDGRGSLGPMANAPVSHPRSSNRACRFPAPGFPTGFTARHTTAGRSLLVSGDDTSARRAARLGLSIKVRKAKGK